MFLYLIKCQQFYKIGIAGDVESRLAQLSTGNPFPLEVSVVYEFENAEPVERAIHQKYKDIRKRGEWFELSYQDTVDIHNICLMLGGSAYEYTGKEATQEVIEEADEIGDWLELVKVKKWYSIRQMRWDATGKKKVYVKYIGTLEKCKADPIYSAEAHRLEKLIDGKDVTLLVA